MEPNDLKKIIIEMNEASWHSRDLDKVYSYYADDISFHRAPFPPVSGKVANMEADKATLSAFSDIKSTILELVVEGDTVVAHWKWQGIHSGTLQSLGLPATGKQIQFSGCSIYHFKEGKIFEQREYGDMLAFMMQLGVISMPG